MMAIFATVEIEDSFKNRGRICKMVEEAVWELGISDKLEKVAIKPPPSGSSTDMNYLDPKTKSLELEIVDSLENLEGRVLHELMHVVDQLNKKFKYQKSREPSVGTAELRRYKYFWNIYIDSRLLKGGRPAYESCEAREKEMEEYYPELSTGLRKKIFDYLWGREPFDQRLLAKMGHDLFSASKDLEALSNSHGETLQKFKSLEDLQNYGK